MEIFREWEDDHIRDRVDAFYVDYVRVQNELIVKQREFLKTLNKKEGISDGGIRNQLALLDLEQEKMRQYFEWNEADVIRHEGKKEENPTPEAKHDDGKETSAEKNKR
ncbi:hypothetical protein EGI32_11590 [Ferruginibacter sp. HRS2-29]|nr:hypothetical protein [Ferruginibacter sp. HRS2-29]